MIAATVYFYLLQIHNLSEHVADIVCHSHKSVVGGVTAIYSIISDINAVEECRAVDKIDVFICRGMP